MEHKCNHCNRKINNNLNSIEMGWIMIDNKEYCDDCKHKLVMDILNSLDW